MRDHARVTGVAGYAYGLQGLRHGPDLVELNESGICHVLRDRAANDGRVGHEVVVADDLDTMSEFTRLKLPAGPIVFS